MRRSQEKHWGLKCPDDIPERVVYGGIGSRWGGKGRKDKRCTTGLDMLLYRVSSGWWLINQKSHATNKTTLSFGNY